MKLVIFFILIFIRFGISNDEVKLKNIDNNNCLQLASYPDGSIQGVESSELNSNEAITACKKAIKSFPDKPIFKTLLARSYEAQFEMSKALDLFKEAANAGEKYAQFGLANFYFNGNIVKKNLIRAFELTMESAKQGNSNAIFAIGYNFFNGYGVEINYKEALSWYKKAALAENSFAFYNLGHLYHFGPGVRLNYKEAMKWYLKAAAMDNSSAQYNIAILYSDGKGVEKNDKLALEWFKKSATNKKPLSDAMVNLGYFYSNGIGVEKNNKESLKWYLKAAKAGNSLAQYNIALFYSDGVFVAQDFKKARSWYLKSANQGYVKAEFNLALLYLNGKGIEKNLEKGLLWLKKAANKNLPEAQYNLGLIYSNQKNSLYNAKEAIFWYEKSASLNYPRANYNLAILYENGMGVEKNLSKAFAYYKVAAELGLDRAQYNLGNFYFKGKEVSIDHKEAYRWFLKASSQEFPEALYYLGLYHELGLGDIKKDKKKSIEYYKRSANKNNVFSQIKLGETFQGRKSSEKEEDAEYWFNLALENPAINKNQRSQINNFLLTNELEREIKSSEKNKKRIKKNNLNYANIITDEGEKIRIFMPTGFCKGNDSVNGKEHLNFLINRHIELGEILNPKYVIYPCKRVSDYPFGSIAILTSKDQYYSQEHLNNEMANEMNQKNTIFQDLVKTAKKINKSHKKEKNEIVIKEFGSPQALWKDENIIIYTLKLKGNFRGEEVTEIQTISSIYYKGYVIYYFINELEKDSFPGNNIQLMKDVAYKIKSFNNSLYATNTNDINYEEKNKSNKTKESISLDNSNSNKKVALLIANENYNNGVLSNPINDIELLSQVLKEKMFTVYTAKNLDYKNFRVTLNKFKENIKILGKDTVVLFYYAGHGIQYEGNNYLIPIKSEIKNSLDIETETINLNRIFSAMYESKSIKIILLDACRNNPYKSFMRSTDRGLAQVITPGGSIIGYSTSPGKVAEDGFGSNSPYALALTKAINIPNLKIEEVLKRTRISVMEQTTNNQIPWDSSSLTKEFYFSPIK